MLKKEFIWEWPIVTGNAVNVYDFNNNFVDKSIVDTMSGSQLNSCSYYSKTTNDSLSVFNYEYMVPHLQSSPYELRPAVHKGLDISTLSAEKCYNLASADGEIIYMDNKNSGRAGNYINIKHIINGKTYISRYMHMEIFCNDLYEQYTEAISSGKTGLFVKKGTILGITGGTGGSTTYGVHLHFEICTALTNNNTGYSADFIDPVLFDKVNILENYEFNTDSLFVPTDSMFIRLPVNITNTDSSSTGSDNDIINENYYQLIKKVYFNEEMICNGN